MCYEKGEAHTDSSDRKVSAILAQMKLISIKRLERGLYVISNDLLNEIKKRLRSFLNLRSSF